MRRKIDFGKGATPPEQQNDTVKQDNKKKIIEVKNFEDIKSYLEGKYKKKINFNITTVAEELGTSYEFIRQRIHTGQIPATKYGRRITISEQAFIKLLMEGLE